MSNPLDTIAKWQAPEECAMTVVPTCGLLVDAWKTDRNGFMPIVSDLVYEEFLGDLPNHSDRVRAFVRKNPGLPLGVIGDALKEYSRWAAHPARSMAGIASQLTGSDLEEDEYGGRWIAGTCPNPMRWIDGIYTFDSRRTRWKRELPKSPTAELVSLHRAKMELHGARRALREVLTSGIESSAAATSPTS